MTREEAIAQLKQLQTGTDIEVLHGKADDVLCDLLEALGYSDVVAEWHLVDKWYA
jgi:hypothetical protein